MRVVGQTQITWVLASLRGGPSFIFNMAKIISQRLHASGLKLVQNGILQAPEVLQNGFDSKRYVRGCISKPIDGLK